MGVSGRYQFARAGGDDAWSYSLNFRRMIFGTVSASLTFEHRSAEGAGVYAALTWTPSDAISAQVIYGFALTDADFSGAKDRQDRGLSFRLTLRPARWIK